MLILLLGCSTTTTSTPSQIEELTPSEPIAAQVVPTVGVGTVEVPIRLVNNYNIAVPG